MFLNRVRNDERGSIPLTLIAVIVIGGLLVVLTSRTVAGERSVRFDQQFTDAYHVAEVGTQQAAFQLDAGVFDGLAVGATSSPTTTVVDGNTVEWTVTRDDSLSYTVTSQGEENGVQRTLQQAIDEDGAFFPGAFGDTLVGFNGTSTQLDSYNSACTGASTATCGWGTDPAHGTGNGSVGTNDVLDFSGNPNVRPGGALLYDWADNPAVGVSAGDPFGDRCDGNSKCNATYVSTIDERLEFASDGEMAFITSALANCGAGQEKGNWVLANTGSGNSVTTPVLTPFDGGSPAGTSPFKTANYYCANSLDFRDSTTLAASATRDNPVVIFVRDFVTISSSQTRVNCANCDKNVNTPGQHRSQEPGTFIRPVAPALQIYVASQSPGAGAGGNDVFYKSGSIFAGVLYAPRARCSGNGNATIYGSLICGSLDNVGGWGFHYDDALSGFGRGTFTTSLLSEEPSATP